MISSLEMSEASFLPETSMPAPLLLRELRVLDAHVADALLHAVRLKVDAGAGARAFRVAEDRVRDLESVDLDDGQSLPAVVVGDDRAKRDVLGALDIEAVAPHLFRGHAADR